MTTALPRIELDLSILPDELTVSSLSHPDIPSWLVMRSRAHVTTICDICGDVVGPRAELYYESGRAHPAHPGCWFVQLTARPIRVVSVVYR